MFGKHHTKETKEKISLSLGGTGIPYEYNKYTVYFLKVREQIRYRDNYKCQICGIKQKNCIRKLSVHHNDYNKDNIAYNNLVSLCSQCHVKTNRNRDYWFAYFKYIMED